MSAAEHRFEERRRDVSGNPLNIGAYLDMLRAASEHRAELAELELAATRAAAELLTLSGDPGWGDSWFDPFGWVDDPAIPRREIDDDILEDGSFDPETIKQRHIGSCSLLSALASLMNSDRGDEWIRKNIRWDEAREGYWVTLYTDGVPVDVFVDHVYGQGAEQGSDGFWVFDGGEPGIASLYEAAVAQHIGYDDLNDGISGVTAMELLTGENGTYIEAPYPGQNETWTQVTDALERGDPVNTGTLTDIGGDGSWDVEVQRLDSDDNLVTDQVSIRGNHAYAIVGSEPDGSVWIMNPWGPGNGADGGGAFLVPPEVFSNLFHGVTISEIPS